MAISIGYVKTTLAFSLVAVALSMGCQGTGKAPDKGDPAAVEAVFSAAKDFASATRTESEVGILFKNLTNYQLGHQCCYRSFCRCPHPRAC